MKNGGTRRNILILGQFFCGNLGDPAIFNAITGLLRQLGEYDVEGWPIKAPQFVGLRNRYSPAWFLKVAELLVAGVPSYYVQLIRKVRRSDLVMIGGGHLVLDHTVFAPLQFLAACAVAKMMRKPLFICAVGVGPIGHDLSKVVYRLAFRLAHLVSVRDEFSFHTVTDVIGYTSDKMSLTADPAIATSPKPGHKLRTESVVGISTIAYEIPSHNVGGDGAKYDKYVSDIAVLVNLLSHRRDTRVTLIPSDVPDDVETMEDIYKRVTRKDSVTLTYPTTADDLIETIADCDLLIGTRLHPMILALSQHVPIIGVVSQQSNRGKIEALFQALKWPDLVFDVEEFPQERVASLVDTMLDAREEYADQVKRRIAPMQERARTNATLAKGLLDGIEEAARPLDDSRRLSDPARVPERVPGVLRPMGQTTSAISGSHAPSNGPWTTGLSPVAGSFSTIRLAADSLWFLFIIEICHRFGPLEMGIFASGFAISALVYAAATIGVEDYGIREFLRLRPEARPKLIGRLFASQAALMAVLLLGVLGFLSIAGASAETRAIVVLLALYQMALATARTMFIPQLAAQSAAEPVLLEFLCRGLGVATSSFLILGARSSLITSVAAFTAAGLLMVVLAARSLARHGQSVALDVSWRDLLDVARQAWPIASADIVVPFYARADVVLILWIVGSAAAGVYAAAFGFLELGFVPLFLFGAVAYPALSRSDGRSATDVASAVGWLASGCLFVSGLIAWSMIFLVPRFAVLLLGERFGDVAFLVKLMAVLVPLMAIEIIASRLLLASHRGIARVTGQWWATVVNVLLSLALVPRFGMLAAVASAVIGLLVLDGFYLGAIARSAVPLKTFWTSLEAFLALTVVTVISAWVCWSLRAPAWSIAAVSLVTYAAGARAVGLVPFDPRRLLKPRQQEA